MATETRAALFALALAAAGCGGTNSCRDQTVLLSITLDAAAAQADALDIDVTVDGSTSTSHLSHAIGSTSGTVEVRFPSGYPTGKSISIDVTALAGGSAVGNGTTSVSAASGCANASLSVSGGAVVQDLSMTGDLTSSVADLSSPDLSMPIADLAVYQDLATFENCYNGIDDNGDGKIDCADPQCTPVAECVPDPGSSATALGTVGSGACAFDYPTTTALFGNLTAGTCSSGSCQCMGGFVSTPTCSTTLNKQSTTLLSCNNIGTTVFANKTNLDGCIAFTQETSTVYYALDTVKLNAACNAPSGGTAMKNAPTFGSTSKFCSGAPVGSGCTAGNVCVPKAANHCILTNGPSATCSVAGYTVADPSAYFTGFDDSARTCACACNVNGTCSNTVGVTSNTGTCNSPIAFNGGGCSTGNSWDHMSIPGPSGTACTTGATASGATSTSGFERTLCCTN